jgi:hypothetical protein
MVRSRLVTKFSQVYYEVNQQVGQLQSCATGAEVSACVDTVVCEGHEGICVICQEELSAGEEGTTLRSCAHTFHSECVQGWLLGCKRECPICKEELAPWPPRPSPYNSPALAAAFSADPGPPEAQLPLAAAEMASAASADSDDMEELALAAAIALSLDAEEGGEVGDPFLAARAAQVGGEGSGEESAYESVSPTRTRSAEELVGIAVEDDLRIIMQRRHS